jgi:hypothetical protein
MIVCSDRFVLHDVMSFLLPALPLVRTMTTLLLLCSCTKVPSRAMGDSRWFIRQRPSCVCCCVRPEPPRNNCGPVVPAAGEFEARRRFPLVVFHSQRCSISMFGSPGCSKTSGASMIPNSTGLILATPRSASPAGRHCHSHAVCSEWVVPLLGTNQKLCVCCLPQIRRIHGCYLDVTGQPRNRA